MIQQASAVQTSNGWVVWVPIDGQHEIHCVGPSRQRWSHTRLASPYANGPAAAARSHLPLCADRRGLPVSSSFHLALLTGRARFESNPSSSSSPTPGAHTKVPLWPYISRRRQSAAPPLHCRQGLAATLRCVARNAPSHLSLSLLPRCASASAARPSSITTKTDPARAPPRAAASDDMPEPNQAESDLNSVHRGPVDRGLRPVHGTVPLVDDPFEFADDPVLEEQVQQQFAEEGNFTRCDDCALALDAIDPSRCALSGMSGVVHVLLVSLPGATTTFANLLPKPWPAGCRRSLVAPAAGPTSVPSEPPATMLPVPHLRPQCASSLCASAPTATLALLCRSPPPAALGPPRVPPTSCIGHVHGPTSRRHRALATALRAPILRSTSLDSHPCRHLAGEEHRCLAGEEIPSPLRFRPSTHGMVLSFSISFVFAMPRLACSCGAALSELLWVNRDEVAED
ncbi:hypothetical protein HU200_060114 [Digitaria exilis]|uniref:Uncharacterized protein n=1 Tax=Digitaria exilis TaxID=1010633 RepID=A0A835A719_9POAL|nr:hypothetical protein HU200_060114 [Digitaria exilis]